MLLDAMQILKLQMLNKKGRKSTKGIYLGFRSDDKIVGSTESWNCLHSRYKMSSRKTPVIPSLVHDSM